MQGNLLVAALTNVEPMLEHGVAGGLPFRPVADGTVLPTNVLATIRGGSAENVPLITGTTREEWKLFSLMDFQAVDADVLRARLQALTGDADKALAVYADEVASRAPKDAFTVIATDLVFRHPAIALGEAQLDRSADVWEYQFDWATPAMGGMLGSCHALELPFLFGMCSDPRLVGFLARTRRSPSPTPCRTPGSPSPAPATRAPTGPGTTSTAGRCGCSTSSRPWSTTPVPTPVDSGPPSPTDHRSGA